MWNALSLILVGLLWGATNPFIKKGSQGIQKVEANSRIKKLLLEIKFIVCRWQYWIPFLLNQSGSLVYFFTLQNTELSLAVPVANSLTFVFTAITAKLLGEEKLPPKALCGILLILVGTTICMIDRIKTESEPNLQTDL
ncbi:transmembrane protein 234 homolog [Phlebotomus argentipes]|uniref:transmembrane protein 234 homolog n=1 Tax=Phlebotomus argentipes TaxID=94469 RepID=UPI002892A5EC|nr:transmembrane protein 234 homolog [Phlebotomus argentipes]